MTEIISREQSVIDAMSGSRTCVLCESVKVTTRRQFYYTEEAIKMFWRGGRLICMACCEKWYPESFAAIQRNNHSAVLADSPETIIYHHEMACQRIAEAMKRRQERKLAKRRAREDD